MTFFLEPLINYKLFCLVVYSESFFKCSQECQETIKVKMWSSTL